MNKEKYIHILRRFRDAFRRKRPQKWRTDSWFLLHDNAPAHRSVLVKDFLTKNSVITLQHLTYSPDIAPADFYLFPGIKSVLKGRRFCDSMDIVKNATEELKRLSQWLPGMFPAPLPSLTEVCICTRGLFWMECSLNDFYCFVFHISQVISETFWTYHVF